jgi:putative N-acetylmannosamine-6-phosphate epimerase
MGQSAAATVLPIIDMVKRQNKKDAAILYRMVEYLHSLAVAGITIFAFLLHMPCTPL